MLHQQRSMASKNWREPQASVPGDMSDVSRNLSSLRLTDARLDRGGKHSKQLPTVDENDECTAAISKKNVSSAGEMLASMRGSRAPRFEGRNFSTHSLAPGADMLLSPPNLSGYCSNAASRGPESSAGMGNVQQPQKLSRHTFKPGMILRCSMHEEDCAGTSRGADITVASKFVSKSFAGNVFTKIRIMIVVATHKHHYCAVPLYTHNGNGLSKKTTEEKVEYISVRDHRIEGKFIPQSEHGFLRTEYIKPGINILDPRSTAHINYSLPRKYDLPVVFQGYLSGSATDRLVKLYRRLALKEEDA